ncbi:dapD [Helicobacter didelphidarum]|uniref:DapD n=1 Tax=Helicobacter didelphidarum TaxID=2040648 RepID=A0A3D8ISJ3_9HELI|nr:tetrahydrodipicolinate N-succinyltransferase N-terminal domain-containing protein [Helicobacter didelphidarum]RDU67594.1 dapD [Helicobacter didelphidarum]
MLQFDSIKTKDDFKLFVEEFYQKYPKPKCFGICRSIQSAFDKNKTITLNFPFLNFENNFGSFAVFVSSAELTTIQNETIVDIDLKFIIRALCFYYPFIIEELEKIQNTELLQEFQNFYQQAVADIHKFSDSDNLYFLKSYWANVFQYIGKTHKNIQIILESFVLLRLMLPPQDELYDPKKPHFQFVAFVEDKKTESLQVAYAKLHALSQGYAPLRSLNLDGIFGLFPNLAWSGNMPYELEYLRENEIHLKMKGRFPCIDYIDKFPRYLMQVLPQADNIRILDTAKTRFGAFLGAGYTQMPGASYVNFNSGSLGACMNEGRISSSVIVGEGTDIGGGASILGVLSGGNTTPISIGKNCLLGANSVTGISLGNGCIVDAGISILSGSIVSIDSAEAHKIQEINSDFVIESNGLYKGVKLSGLHGIHFRITSQDSKLIAFRSAREIKLNTDLH